jgi:hypothetical protein
VRRAAASQLVCPDLIGEDMCALGHVTDTAQPERHPIVNPAV